MLKDSGVRGLWIAAGIRLLLELPFADVCGVPLGLPASRLGYKFSLFWAWCADALQGLQRFEKAAAELTGGKLSGQVLSVPLGMDLTLVRCRAMLRCSCLTSSLTLASHYPHVCDSSLPVAAPCLLTLCLVCPLPSPLRLCVLFGCCLRGCGQDAFVLWDTFGFPVDLTQVRHFWVPSGPYSGQGLPVAQQAVRRRAALRMGQGKGLHCVWVKGRVCSAAMVLYTA